MTSPDDIHITPGTWHRDDGPDPDWRVMPLAVTGAAPGRWDIRNSGAGWYFHIRHNGRHIGMTHWNAWDAVRVYIAHESGPYTVTFHGDFGPVHLSNQTLTDARVAVVSAEKHGATATITDPDGNEVTFPRRPDPED